VSPAADAPRPRPPLLLPALGLYVLIAAGTFLVAKRTLTEFPPLPLALFRFVLASAVLWPLVRLVRPTAIAPEDRGRIRLLGFLAVPLNQGLFLFGMQWASASHAALLYALTPAFVVIFGMRASGVPSVRQIGGVVLAFVGVFTLLLQRGLHVDPRSLHGDLLVFLAVIAWALFSVLGRTVIRRYGALPVTAEALREGTLLYLPLGLVGLIGFDVASISPAGWSGLFYLAWLTSALNYVIWFWGIEHLKPATVALLTNLQPVVTVAMAWLFLGEALPGGFVLSTALVIGGVWLAQVERLRGG
jgi:drug/metabolite transporter (DMT)-like permease